MTYDEKVKWLKRYRISQREKRELEDEVEQLRADAERVTQLLSPTPGGHGNNDKLPAAVEQIVAAQERLQDKIYETYEIRAEIEAAIESIRTDRGREILRRRYLLCQRWEVIAAEMILDFRWVTRLHKHIVENLEITP